MRALKGNLFVTSIWGVQQELHIWFLNDCLSWALPCSFSFTNHNYLKDNGNNIIANVLFLGTMKAIIWVVRQQCGHMEHHLVIKSFHKSGSLLNANCWHLWLFDPFLQNIWCNDIKCHFTLWLNMILLGRCWHLKLF